MNSNRSRLIAMTLGAAAGSLLAAGLTIAAALATPGIASADESSLDQLLTDLLDPSGAPIQIAIGGTDLFPVTADSPLVGAGPTDIAIAIGNGAFASAGDSGLFDFAFADGTDSYAIAQVGSFDTAIAEGADSAASPEFGSFDTAIADGTDSTANAGGVVTGIVESIFGTPVTTYDPGSFDFAQAVGDMLHASAIGNFITDILPSL
jgi:hypothetical protein